MYVVKGVSNSNLLTKFIRTPPYNADFEVDEMIMQYIFCCFLWHTSLICNTQSDRMGSIIGDLTHHLSSKRSFLHKLTNPGIVQDTPLRDCFLDWTLWLPEWDGSIPTEAFMVGKSDSQLDHSSWNQHLPISWYKIVESSIR